jgi:hypothetical protein
MPDREASSRMSSPNRAWGVLVLLLGACAPSEEEIEAEFEAFVSSRNRCEVATDCVLVGLDCPLGCFIAVHSQHARAVLDKGRELVDDYESGGRSCAYDCAQPPPLECRRGRCFPGTRWYEDDAGAR